MRATSHAPKTVPPLASHGFSLVELVVVVLVVALLAAIAFPMLARTKQSRQLSDVTRQLTAAVARARGLAVAGETNPAWPAGTRAQSAGIRLVSPTQFVVFIDANTVVDGNEVNLEIYDLLAKDPGTTVQVAIAPAPEVRIRRDGTLIPGTGNVVTLSDTAGGRSKTVNITMTAQTSVQ